MSVCTFFASDAPLDEVIPSRKYPIAIRLESGAVSVYDGGADDNFSLHTFTDAGVYTDKKYAVSLWWACYTEGRAKRIVEYVQDVLRNTDSVELWHVWLMDYWEYEDRPIIHKTTVRLEEFTADHIREIDGADIWNVPDRWYPDRPSFYCLTITK